MSSLVWPFGRLKLLGVPDDIRHFFKGDFLKHLSLSFIFSFLCFMPGFAQVRLVDGVVLHTDNQALFAFTPDKSVIKIDLNTGAIIWQNKSVDQPLGLVEGSLVTLVDGARNAGQMQLVFVNPDTGQALQRAVVGLPLNEAVHRNIDNSVDSAFSMQMEMVDTGLQLWWQSSKQNISPVLMSGNQSRTPQIRSCSFTYNLSTQALTATNQASPAPTPTAPTLIAKPAQLANVEGRVFASNDGQHWLVPKRVGDSADRYPYEWQIFQASDGQYLGQIANETTLLPFVVRGDLVIFVAQPFLFFNGQSYDEYAMRLRAVNLKTQAEVWTRDIRDTKYRGVLPP